nr:tyrosine-type recombinase/integrase [Massilia rubra]
MIASCDPSVPLGARDRAILLLIARLGLRASDVSSLPYSQLLWSKNTVRVAGKNRREVELPLPQEVGDAILHDRQHRRPYFRGASNRPAVGPRHCCIGYNRRQSARSRRSTLGVADCSCLRRHSYPGNRPERAAPFERIRKRPHSDS